MHDRPTVDELLRGIEIMLDEQFVPSLDGALRYNARVASNVVKAVRRELQLEERQLDAEWRGLDIVLSPMPRPASLAETKRALQARNEELAERIREGDADAGEFRALVIAHVRDVVAGKLEVANPGWLKSSDGGAD